MKIMTKQELVSVLDIEKRIYSPRTKKEKLWVRIFKPCKFYLYKFIIISRILEYVSSGGGKPKQLLSYYFQLRRNFLANKLGMELNTSSFGVGLRIWHPFGIVVNGDAKIGNNCVLHGGNVIGNRGHTYKCPVIGNNVRLGAGSKVLGDVYIADGVQIGAGAVVIHSCYNKNAVLVGVPAKEIKCVNDKLSDSGEILEDY